MDWIVLSHTLDADAGAYVLVVGGFQDVLVASESDQDQNGAAVEAVPVQVAQQDFLFASEDPRWADRDVEDVAAEQREIVRAKLAEQADEAEAEAERRAGQVKQLGGEGEAL